MIMALLAAAMGELTLWGGLPMSVAIVLLAIGLYALACQKSRVAGTTLVAPWYWSALSLMAIAGGEIAISLADPVRPPGWGAPLRFVAAMSTFCPIMALLGAKRPQDRAWQFIVASLWLILSLPAGKWLFFGGVQEVHAAWIWFVGILICVAAINGLFTRSWATALLYAAGQIALVGPAWPTLLDLLPGSGGICFGLVLIVAGWLLAAFQRPCAASPFTPWNNVWLDFRDAYGLVWGLRVAERINSSTAMYDWPIVLAWSGFETHQNRAPAEVLSPAVEESMAHSLAAVCFAKMD